MSTAYLNGVFLPLDRAQISVMDRGFLFGDGVYEVIPVYGSRLFRLERHLRRLRNSLDAIRIGNPLVEDDWKSVLAELVAANHGGDQTVYLQVTRGAAARRDHAFPVDSRPTVFAVSMPCPLARDIDHEPGVSAITLADIRWRYCNVKAITLLANILLPGVTRDLILELAQANAIPCREASISAEELAGADEIWLTSSTREISPVVRLDARAVGGGRPGPAWHRMIRLFQDYKEAVRLGEAA
jgi:D-alanine transaminase